MRKLSLKAVRAIFTDCTFNPNNPGTIKPIIDADNLEYYRERAVELIRTSAHSQEPNEHLKRAIQVLVLAILKNELQ